MLLKALVHSEPIPSPTSRVSVQALVTCPIKKIPNQLYLNLRPIFSMVSIFLEILCQYVNWTYITDPELQNKSYCNQRPRHINVDQFCTYLILLYRVLRSGSIFQKMQDLSHLAIDEFIVLRLFFQILSGMSDQ